MKPASVPEARPAMSWASAIGLGARLEEAIAEATEQLEGESGGSRHDLSIAFVSAAYGAAFEKLPQLLRPVIGDSLLIGCNAGGLIGGGSEEEEEPGIALLCGRMPDAVLACQHLEQATLPSLTAPREKWWRLLELGPESEPSFVLLADPTTLDAEACARGLDRAFPGSTVIGGLTSGMLEPGTARSCRAAKSTNRRHAARALRQRRHRPGAGPGMPADRRPALRDRVREQPS
jgi:small ligand-binding sensory domain FIST